MKQITAKVLTGEIGEARVKNKYKDNLHVCIQYQNYQYAS